MRFRIPFDRVNWLNTIFLFFISALAVIAAPIYLFKFGMDWFMGGLFLFYVIATGLSITLGYHRLFSHLSFKAKWPVRLATLVFGACAFENSVLCWASDHRRHHKHTDHDDDPYDISKGFFWAHIGWILFKVDPEPPLDNVADLRKDKLVMWQARWDKWVAMIVGLFLPAALCFWWTGSWVGALGGFLVVGALRVFVVQQSTFFINSLCHTLGRQPYSTRCSAKVSTLMAFLTFGEGYHNYHHAMANDYRNGIRWYHFDPTKWLIWTCSKIGITSDLKRVHKVRLQKLLVRKDKDLLLERFKTEIDEKTIELKKRAEELAHTFEDKASEVLRKVRELKDATDAKRAELKREIRELKRELRIHWKEWIELTQYVVRNYQLSHAH